MHRKKILTSILVATCLVAAPANANVGAGMSSWFNSMGGFSNTTPPSSYKGQTMNGYSGGGVYVRTPVKNYQLAQMTAPSLNIGCGGIDLTAGSFSFINRAALTSMFQNIGTSLSYAFLLAIKASMPSMASAFEYLQDVANKVNSMNVNSCEMAEGIVTAGSSLIAQKQKSGEDHTVGSFVNSATDAFSAWNDTALNKIAARRAAEAADPTAADKLSPGNIVWGALSKTTGLDDQDKEFIMSITGTVVINEATATTKAFTQYSEPSDVKIEDIIGFTTDGSAQPLNLYVCTDKVKCLTFTKTSVPAKSFMYLVSQKIDNLKNNMLARTQQTSGDLQLIDVSSLPVWKMISIATNYNPGYVDTYKRLIAVDLAYAYVSAAIVTARGAMSNYRSQTQAADTEAELGKMLKNLDTNEALLFQMRQAEYGKAAQNVELQREIQLMHQTMIAGLPAQSFNSIMAFGSQR